MCDGFLDAGECTSYTKLGAHACVYCAKDKECHDVGSPYNPCSNDCCASQSSVSTCKWKDMEDIPQSCYPTKPEQVHIAWAGQSARGYPNAIAVSWYTHVTTDTSVVNFGTERNALSATAKGPQALQYLKSHGYHHHVTLPDLTPATEYFYQVGDDVGGFSEVLHFTTPSDDSQTPWTAAIFGDMGYLGSAERGPMVVPGLNILSKNWSAVPTRQLLEKLKDEGKFDWLMLLGDIGYADDAFADSLSFSYEEVYNGYMNWMQNLSSTLPFMVNPGNHETECHSPACVLQSKYHEPLRNFSAYNARFKMPSASSGGVMNMWYSFNIGPVHWIGINSETDWPGAAEEKHGESGLYKAGGFAPDGAYLAWLEEDLKNANANRAERPWIIASGHRPIAEIQSSMGPLFDKYNIDLYLSGHKHSYFRSMPTDINGTIDRKAMVSDTHYHDAEGCTYIVVGSAGCDEMNYLADPVTGKLKAVEHVHDLEHVLPSGSTIYSARQNFSTARNSMGLLHASVDSLEWQLLASIDGEVIDHLTITKTPKTPTKTRTKTKKT